MSDSGSSYSGEEAVTCSEEEEEEEENNSGDPYDNNDSEDNPYGSDDADPDKDVLENDGFEHIRNATVDCNSRKLNFSRSQKINRSNKDVYQEIQVD